MVPSPTKIPCRFAGTLLLAVAQPFTNKHASHTRIYRAQVRSCMDNCVVSVWAGKNKETSNR